MADAKAKSAAPRRREFVVQRAGPEDAPAIAGLWHVHLAQTSGEVDATFTPAISLQQTTARLKRALAAGTLVGWIARAKGQTRQELAGYLTAKVLTEDPLLGDVFKYAPVLYIVDVDVEVTFRHRGVSGQLLDAATRHARAAGIRTLELAAIVRDARAVNLWKRHGFEPRVSVMRKAVKGVRRR